jgi:hypothetical protein
LEQPDLTEDYGKVGTRYLGLDPHLAAAAFGQSKVGISEDAQPSDSGVTRLTGVPIITSSMVEAATGVRPSSASRYLHWKGRVFDFDTGDEVINLQPVTRNALGPQIHMSQLPMSRISYISDEQCPSLNSSNTTADANADLNNAAAVFSPTTISPTTSTADQQTRLTRVEHMISSLQSQLQTQVTNLHGQSGHSVPTTVNTRSNNKPGSIDAYIQDSNAESRRVSSEKSI